MFYVKFLQICLIGIFLLGGSFSCAAFTEEINDIHKSISHEKEDSCCPKNGHKTQLEGKGVFKINQKEKTDTGVCRNFGNTLERLGNTFLYTSLLVEKHTDKQSLFFLHTIKLLL